MNDLAVVVTAFDEAELLPRCLESVAYFGETWVSVDQATTDDSLAVAAEFTPNLLQHQGLPAEALEQDHPQAPLARNSYSRMRNEVLDAVCARSRALWLMWLDADELMTRGHQELLALLPEQPPEVPGIAVPMHLYNGPYCESIMRNAKIIRREVRFTRRRHEHITAEGPQTICNEAVIEHRPTQRAEVRAAHDKRKQNQQAYLEDWREFGDGRACFYYGHWWWSRGEREEALRWFDKGLSLGPEKCPPAQRSLMAIHAARRYLELEQIPEARRLYFDALQHDWNNAETMYYLGFIAANTGMLSEAKHWFNLALQFPPTPMTIMQQEVGCSTDLPLHGLAAIAEQEGDRAEAYRLLAEAEACASIIRPGFAELRQKLDEG